MAAPRGLHRLARLHGIQQSYTANDGRRVRASADALLATLHALRVPVESGDDVERLADHRERELWERMIEPVVVAWVDGEQTTRPSFLLRIPVSKRDASIAVRIGLEDGGERSWTIDPAALAVEEVAEIGGVRRAAVRAPLPSLPPGYHDLAIETGRARWTALLISAPQRAHGWDGRGWGLFAPLYALWERGREDAAPSFRLLDALAQRVEERGGDVVGTLPLLAAFLDQPYEPSPYSPVSRLFWNEVYVEPPGAEGRARAPGAFVDFRSVMAEKRPPLEAAAAAFFADGEPAEMASFRARNPRADDYACFRALVERLGSWGGWPDRLRARDVRPSDFDADVAQYHLYVQWLAERQLAEATERARSRGVGLYLDLPLGVHPDGYDVWRDRALFATRASAGAPPDPLAAGGQDWGFPPLHPEAARLDRHRYFIASIRTHLRFAKVLRIDHVMQLHRMFWVASGDARNGVYVRYPAEELYALLSLESHRAGAVIVGEDLGTVPPAVRRGMRRHGFPGMYVAEFELTEDDNQQQHDKQQHNQQLHNGQWLFAPAAVLVPKPVRDGVVGSVGTHDTPTFAGWWTGRDLELARERGALEAGEAERELEGRAEMRAKLSAGLGASGAPGGGAARAGAAGAEAGGGAGGGGGEDEGDDVARNVLRGLHRHLGRSACGLVLATVEDLWLETEPQNVPGTTGDRNWRRRARRPVEALEEPDVAELLEELDESRRKHDED